MIECVGNQGMGGADRDPEVRCDVGDAIAAKAVHFQGHPRSLGQFLKCCLKHAQLIAGDRLGFGVRAALGDLPDICRVAGDGTAVLAVQALPYVESQVPHDAKQIGEWLVKRLTGGAPGLGTLQAQVGILNDIFREASLADDPRRITDELAPMIDEGSEYLVFVV